MKCIIKIVPKPKPKVTIHIAPKPQPIPPQSGVKFELDVLNYIKLMDTPKTSWQQYLLSMIGNKANVKSVERTPSSLGKAGDTTDVQILMRDGKTINLSCKNNNDYLSHPRCASFLKDSKYRIMYDVVKKEFDADTCVDMFSYYHKLSEITRDYIIENTEPVFKFLYPSNMHIIHNKRQCVYYAPVPVPTPTSVKCYLASDNNLRLEFSNGIVFNMRIHNAEGKKAKLVTNPFKWEVSLKNDIGLRS